MSDPTGTVTEAAVTNADAPWDSFNSDAYYDHNYGRLRKDDAQIINLVAGFFHDFFQKQTKPAMARAIDVGSGTNLYPALTMLPYASEITLFERAYTNRKWLGEALETPQASWSDFWAEISRSGRGYQRISRPLEILADRARIEKGNVFDLERRQYDLGTMFFVAESITTREDEFRRATLKFVDSLTPRAPFAATFMSGSAGYRVGDQDYPACSIDQSDVKECLAECAHIEDIETVESHDLRDGYCGMIVVRGWKR